MYVQPQGKLLRFKVQLACVLREEDEEGKQLSRSELHCRELVFKSMCFNILKQIGPKGQQIDIHSADGAILFSL